MKALYQNFKTSLLVFPLLLIGAVCAQAQSARGISGTVFSINGAPLPMASVTIDTLNAGVSCDENGTYQISIIRSGTYRVIATLIGFKKQVKEVTVTGEKSVTVNFSLDEDAHAFEEVTIRGEKNSVQKIREQAFTVSSIDVTPLHNLNLDVNTVLNRSTGIRIRQGGGLGSDFNFSLNGFTGNQVRFFIDGISADFLGSSMRFNNIPVNIIERIEVYKGVVPIYLGADALGGAINIVTSDNAKDFLDVSYSTGSFNTHQAAVASRVKLKEHGVLNASAFYNYSDNNFAVDAQLVDKNTGKIGELKPFKLFNEGYYSGSVMVEGGVVKTKWADRFLIGMIASENRKERQRGRAMVLSPAGQVYTKDHGFTPTLKYQKKNLGIENLSLNVAAVYSTMRAMVVDSSSRIYSWDGSYVYRSFGNTSGELNWYKTMFRFNDRSTFNTATLEYVLGEHHTFTVNNTYSYFWRKGSDPLASEYSASVAFATPNILIKNITGFSYKLSLMDNRWNTTVFFKLFNMNASVQQQDETTNEFYSQTNKKTEFGQGIASSFFIRKQLQLKASYEFTSRLPESYELFGDGLLQLPNVSLEPERSHNVNLGVLYSKRFNDAHVINMETGFLYRLPENMIRAVAIGVLSQFQNLSNASVMSGEASMHYSYKKWMNVELNATYQDMRNNSKDGTAISSDRIPNTPYLFGNAMLNLISPERGEKKIQTGFSWTTMYVEEFYLNWPSQGNKDSKYVIPRQLSHDVSATFSALSGKYNLSFSCLNLADGKLYDNFKVQKPGRSFNVKLRFYISKFRD